MQSTLFDSPPYKKFISDRDKALEQVHNNAQLDVSRILFQLLDQVKKTLGYLLLFLEEHNAISLAETFDKETKTLFNSTVPQIVDRIKSMRHSVYIITYLGEQEAIGRATGKKKKQTPAEFKIKLDKAIQSETILDNQLDKQIWLHVMKLQSDIANKVRVAFVTGMNPHETLDYVGKAFPKVTTYIKPPRQLKPIREANKDSDGSTPDPDFNSDNDSFVDQSDWDLATDAYKGTELPPSRFDNAPSFDSDTGTMRYNWEVEQDLTDDFVSQVRSGQVDAANDLGIEEFVWVAVIDNKTDDCCLQRNGKTTSEIEDGISSGNIDADLCDATSPPAHPNCRCQLAPVSSTDSAPEADFGSFNDWLNS